jgi:2-keto-4-pentenoate hydratase/2-oxohepta-3-ene-1,7-dioic acid hydratase in catechol pathway
LGDPLVQALPALRNLDQKSLANATQWRVDSVSLLSPIVSPSKILAAPNNYRDHTLEMNPGGAGAHNPLSSSLEQAGLFLKATSSLVGPSEGIALRFPDRRTDHEVEAVAVIGRVISGPVSASAALECVAGYSVGLDITLRGPEERSLRKSIDTYTVLGPWLVTTDEVPNLSHAEMRLAINGSLRQTVRLSEMIYGVAEQIAYASRFYTLYPGDLIYTGTPAGVGPIRPGDVLHAEIETIGQMQVHVRLAA